jgi:hypothetical protein
MSIERIVAAVIDTRVLTLYREDGSTIEIAQGDERVRAIIEQVMPVINAGETAIVDIDKLNNNYKQFEEKASGMIRLFRVAKKAVAGIFAEVPVVQEGVYGPVPQRSSQPSMEAVDEIMAGAISVRDADFKESDTTEDHTVIAIVTGDDGVARIIPGAENLKEQFKYSARNGSTKGVENLLKRMAAVIDNRQHSVEDLLRFLQHGDLPIADDGSIIAYKILRNDPDDQEGFVDCHTRKVRQRVGSYVCVNEDLVDKNRRNECSNGLHIARRGYIGNFSGDVVTMCKIAPEDVITVPHGDANKVRVCGYHILFKLNAETYSKLSSNKPATDVPETAKLLSKAIAGSHPKPIEEVRITASYGGGVEITPTAYGKSIMPKSQTAHTALDDEIHKVAVNPLDVSKVLEAIRETGTRKEQIAALMNVVSTGTKAEAYTASLDILALKKAAKQSWAALGIDEAAQQLLATVSQPIPNADPVPTPAPAVLELDKPMTNPEKAREMFINEDWADLVTFKKSKKKSWSNLGFSPAEQITIIARGGQL